MRLSLLTAKHLSELVRARRASIAEIVEDSLAQIDALEPRVKAWVTIDRERALRSARDLQLEAEAGRIRSRLHGIPMGFKDIYHVAGLITAAGAGPFAHQLAVQDATVVQRARDAGGVILGKTTTAEFAYADPAETTNPWNFDHTPGGSSSGSAAAVAACMVPLAFGSQTLGSTLRPAAYCGVVGFKATHGRISCRGVLPSAWSLDHVGIFCRCVDDVALVLGAVAGYDPGDPYSQPLPPEDYAARLSMPDRPPNLGIPVHRALRDADLEVSSNLATCIELFRKNGATVEDVALPPSFEGLHAAGAIVLQAEAAAYHADKFTANQQDYGPRIRSLVATGLRLDAVGYLQARRHLQAFRIEIAESLRLVDALLLPTTPEAAPRGLASTGDPFFCAPWSFAGTPAISIPSGLTAGGLPVGIQLVSRIFGEATLLSVAKWCEALLGFGSKAPTVGN